MYMEGLSFISRMVNHPDPLQDPYICHMISKLKHRTDPSKDKCSPVIIEVPRSLLGTLESVCNSPYECVFFHALFTVAFLGALCIEEMRRKPGWWLAAVNMGGVQQLTVTLRGMLVLSRLQFHSSYIQPKQVLLLSQSIYMGLTLENS